MEGREGGKQTQRRNDRDAYEINSIGRMEEKGDLGRKIVPRNLSQSRVVYCAERNYYYLSFPGARETNYQNFGRQVDPTALSFGGARRAELWGDTRCHQRDKPTAC
jgi:hypothetical protein